MTLRDLYNAVDEFSLDYEVFFDVTPVGSKTLVLKSIDDAMEIQTDDKQKLIIFLNGIQGKAEHN